MAQKSRKSGMKRSQHMQAKILDTITAADALTILRHLAEQDEKMAQRIADVAMECLCNVDPDVEGIARDVQSELESLDVEDVWDRCGTKRDGYVDSGEAAWEMFEEALQPFREEMERYMQLSMRREAKLYCMGILKGLYVFEKESETEYKDWAVDAPCEYFGRLRQEWQEWNKSQKDLAAMDKFVSQGGRAANQYELPLELRWSAPDGRESL